MHAFSEELWHYAVLNTNIVMPPMASVKMKTAYIKCCSKIVALCHRCLIIVYVAAIDKCWKIEASSQESQLSVEPGGNINTYYTRVA